MANWAWKPNRHFDSFSSSMACGKAALSMKKRIQPFRAIPDKSALAPAWRLVGSLQPQRAPTTPAALDETRPAAIDNLKPFTWDQAASLCSLLATIAGGSYWLLVINGVSAWSIEFMRP